MIPLCQDFDISRYIAHERQCVLTICQNKAIGTSVE